MFDSSDKVTVIPVSFPNGSTVMVEARLSGREEVAYEVRNFENVLETLETVATTLSNSLQKVQPDRATIRFGLRFESQSGRLAGVITQCPEATHFEITLEWNKNN
ncbi:MAG: CU044_2847 family protein [Elainellaceae cyanobacterium]